MECGLGIYQIGAVHPASFDSLKKEEDKNFDFKEMVMIPSDQASILESRRFSRVSSGSGSVSKSEAESLSENEVELQDTKEPLDEQPKDVRATKININEVLSAALKSLRQSERTNYISVLKLVGPDVIGDDFERLAYQLLLQPEQTQFRKDFLLAGLSIKSVYKDQNNNEKIPGLVKEMIEILKNPNSSTNQIAVILTFATQLIKKGIFHKNHFKFEEIKNSLEVSKQKKDKELIQIFHKIAKVDSKELLAANKEKQDQELTELWKNFQNATPEKISLAKEISYKSERTVEDLIEIFSKMSVNKKDFIKNFAEDMHTLTSSYLACIDSNEFNKNLHVEQRLETNLSYPPHCSNQLTFFLIQQILDAKSLGKAHKICSSLIKIANSLVHHYHNYEAGGIISAALSQVSIERLLDRKLQSSVAKLSTLYHPGQNNQNITNEITKCKNSKPPLPYVSYFPRIPKILSFINDGNPSLTDGKINFEKMQLFAKVYHSLEEDQRNLRPVHQLHYNLQDLIQNHIFEQDDDTLWNKSKKLKPSVTRD